MKFTRPIFGRRKFAPPAKPFVTFTEAVTWLAFNVSIDNLALDLQLTEAHSWQFDEAREKLILATDQIIALAIEGNIELHGKYIERDEINDKNVKYEIINAAIFNDFGRFHLLTDGLRRGRGLAWRQTEGGFDTAAHERCSAGYHLVKVNRDQLLSKSVRQRLSGYGHLQPAKRDKSPDKAAILEKAAEMRARGMNGRKIATMMRHEPGFGSVKSTLVREYLKGVYGPGRPKKT